MSQSSPAVIAICSDLDETPDAETYFEIMRFLNTTEDTRMGPGVGLEVGNTMYFDMPPGHFSYWNTTPQNREKIRALIKSGHIDCLHSYGDLATTREHAGRALDELAKHNCRFEVWIDHAQAPTNFGADIMQGHGDEPGHVAYHADLTMAHGIKFVWRGRVTSVIGQEKPFSIHGIWNKSHGTASARTITKETLKLTLAHFGSRKYAAHRLNRLIVPGRLRDGQPIREFVRSHPSWAGVSGHDRGDAIQDVLTPNYLDRLVARQGSSVFYTHLGKLDRGETPRALPKKAVLAFRRLAEYQKAGKLRVMTTSRLLKERGGGEAAVEPLQFPDI